MDDGKLHFRHQSQMSERRVVTIRSHCPHTRYSVLEEFSTSTAAHDATFLFACVLMSVFRRKELQIKSSIRVPTYKNSEGSCLQTTRNYTERTLEEKLGKYQIGNFSDKILAIIKRAGCNFSGHKVVGKNLFAFADKVRDPASNEDISARQMQLLYARLLCRRGCSTWYQEYNKNAGKVWSMDTHPAALRPPKCFYVTLMKRKCLIIFICLFSVPLWDILYDSGSIDFDRVIDNISYSEANARSFLSLILGHNDGINDHINQNGRFIRADGTTLEATLATS
ncbi:hypothetical protein CLF_106633 [Clonorchis sinensis]|uniref:Uncharacterized protein n=1 Tax=Clonorchis sinensis TaxID=79923 RepID=G7YQ35_CLOSI|nr:hypothetical protein CLF_106633 [Clonorchis sinensis]